jgi:hypothetical protein
MGFWESLDAEQSPEPGCAGRGATGGPEITAGSASTGVDASPTIIAGRRARELRRRSVRSMPVSYRC